MPAGGGHDEHRGRQRQRRPRDEVRPVADVEQLPDHQDGERGDQPGDGAPEGDPAEAPTGALQPAGLDDDRLFHHDGQMHAGAVHHHQADQRQGRRQAGDRVRDDVRRQQRQRRHAYRGDRRGQREQAPFGCRSQQHRIEHHGEALRLARKLQEAAEAGAHLESAAQVVREVDLEHGHAGREQRERADHQHEACVGRGAPGAQRKAMDQEPSCRRRFWG